MCAAFVMLKDVSMVLYFENLVLKRISSLLFDFVGTVRFLSSALIESSRTVVEPERAGTHRNAVPLLFRMPERSSYGTFLNA